MTGGSAAVSSGAGAGGVLGGAAGFGGLLGAGGAVGVGVEDCDDAGVGGSQPGFNFWR